MASVIETAIRKQLVDRQQKLGAAIAASGGNAELLRLVGEVDAALERINAGSYGLCRECGDSIETNRLIADPLVQLCLDHLTPSQQRALEEDLELAARIQRELLPGNNLRLGGWNASYHYEAAGPVSGDYCDLIHAADGTLYFAVGDVSGKGVAASILMGHLHALFRGLISVGLPLDKLVERASRVFCESTLPTHFATLVCGSARPGGQIDLCNAGHPPPLMVSRSEVKRIEATGLPIGMFHDEQFLVSQVHSSPGDTLLLYTDGLSEARNGAGIEYGGERLSSWLSKNHPLAPQELIGACLRDVAAFRSGAPKTDDLTVMAIRRS